MFSFHGRKPIDNQNYELLHEDNQIEHDASYENFHIQDYKHFSLHPTEKVIIYQYQIPLQRLDPYLLSLKLKRERPYDDKVITLEALLRSYIKLRAKNHPDKGGSAEVFVKISDAIQILHDIEKLKDTDKPHHQLKSQYDREVETNYSEYGTNIDEYVVDEPDETSSSGGRGFHDRFNHYFDKNRLEDETEFGYGERMERSKQMRDDIFIDNTIGKYSSSTFSDAFERNKEERMRENKAQLVLKCVPEAYNDMDGTDSFRFISKPNNCFTAPSRYTDYWDAFHKPDIDVQPYLIIPDTRPLKKRLKDRKKESLEMTEDQRKAYAAYLESKKKEEDNEIAYKRELDDKIQAYDKQQYGKMLKFMTGK